MASDYIYIFCIPGSGSSETCQPSGFSAPAEASLENNRGRGAGGFPRTSAHILPTNSNNISVRTSSGTAPGVGRSRPINRPQSAVMDVPEDWAPLPARQRNGHVSSYRASFPGTRDNIQARGNTDSRQPVAALSEQVPSFAEDSFSHDVCALPSYTTLQNRSPQSVRDGALSPFCAVRWSPRATSSPVRENRRGLCDSRAKDCWRRVFNRECCLRCFVTVTTFRWLLLFFASVGAGCILSGVILGVLYVSLGTSFLVLSIMFMGIGILLVLVICIGWRCTPAGHEPCHLLFNFEHLFDVSRSQRRGQRDRRRDRTLDQNQWFGGMIYPEFRSRTPPPTYIASMMEFDDRRRPRRLSCDDVEMFPNVPTSEAVDPVPATPPPAYRGRSMVRGMPVYCPRALRSRPHSFVAIDSADRGTGGSSSTVIVRANLSSNLDVVGKRTQGVGHGVTASHTLKPQSSDDPTVSVSLSVDDCHVASCSADSS